MELKKTPTRQHKVLRKQIALSAVVMLLSSPVVMSAEWAFEPSVTMGATYDDNFRLLTTEESVSGMTLHPKIRLSKRTEASEITLSGHTLSSRYSDSRFDSDEIMLDFGSSFTNTERSTVKVNAGISRTPTLISEVDDSGRFDEVDRDKDQITFNPSWEYQMSTSSLLQVSYSGQNVDYNGSTSLTNYQYQSLVGSYIIKQSEKNQYGISLVASRYDPDSTDIAITDQNCIFGADGGNCNGGPNFRDPGKPFDVQRVPVTTNITDSYGFYLGITRDFTQSLKGNVSIGLTKSENTLIRNASAFEQANPEVLPANMTPTEVSNAVSTGIINTVTTSTITTVDASLTKEYELTSFTVTLKNSLTPSSNGVVSETSSAGLKIKHEMSPKLTLTADLAANSNQTQTKTRSLDRDYYTAGLGANWKLTKWWRLGANYSYRQQQYDLASDSTDSNRFAITLAYIWPKKSISR